jgi:hypothetical protein
MAQRPLVRSGADPTQVRRAERKVRQADEIFAASLREILATPAGRFVFWTLLADMRVYDTSFDHSGSVMYFREGARNVGLKLRAQIIAADDSLYELMEREARQRDRRLDAESAAAQQPSAQENSDESQG